MCDKKRRSVVKTFREGHGPTKEEFHAAQNGICPLCGKMIIDLGSANYDHVHPHSDGGRVFGNVLLTHVRCNSRRQSTCMGPVYYEILDVVNGRLGWDGKRYRQTVGYSFRMREMAIIDIYDGLGIDIKKLNKYWYVRYPGMQDSHIPALTEHFSIFLKNVEFRGRNEVGIHRARPAPLGSFRVRHDGLK